MSGAPALPIVRDVVALRQYVTAWRDGPLAGRRIGLTPTMGALHDGHLSLVRIAREQGRADRVVATLFVNPKQFGPSEDFGAYPRDEARDAALLAAAGCDLLYAPTPSAMYPSGFATQLHVRGLGEPLCGAARPGHFDGVAVVVAKLLIQSGADVAVFGEKDWQQLAIIRRLARDLDLPTEILGAPTRRAADGLALSSRNAYLTEGERAAAPTLHAAISEAAAAIATGGGADAALAAARARILAAGFARVDYVEARDAADLTPLTASPPPRPARVFAAARLGRARLIDNVAITAPEAT